MGISEAAGTEGGSGVAKRERADAGDQAYDPQDDWVNQRELAGLLQVRPETACRWAGRGELAIFEHGMVGAGRRKYSRQLVREYQRISIQLARRRMRSALDSATSGPSSSRIEGIG